MTKECAPTFRLCVHAVAVCNTTRVKDVSLFRSVQLLRRDDGKPNTPDSMRLADDPLDAIPSWQKKEEPRDLVVRHLEEYLEAKGRARKSKAGAAKP